MGDSNSDSHSGRYYSMATGSVAAMSEKGSEESSGANEYLKVVGLGILLSVVLFLITWFACLCVGFYSIIQ